MDLFSQNQNVERAWTVTAAAGAPLPACQPVRQAGLILSVYAFRPLETKEIDIFLHGARACNLTQLVRGKWAAEKRLCHVFYNIFALPKCFHDCYF